MEKTKAVFKAGWGYQGDQMNLPVADVDAAIPFYLNIMGFKLVSRSDQPHKKAIIGRNDVQLGLAENDGDPTQDGCFFEVDDVQSALDELKSNGLHKDSWSISSHQHGETKWRLFYVIAPDGLCYSIGEKQL